MAKLEVKIEREKGFEDIPLPRRQSPGASGFDLCAAVENSVSILPGEVKLISAGFRMSVPAGFEAQVRPRSGLALKHGIGVLNSPGTIDSDYRGTVGIILFNFGSEPFIVGKGDRIAQMVFVKVECAELKETDSLDASPRGSNGFGSTGTRSGT
jgi:dUTP pyrophosphatase